MKQMLGIAAEYSFPPRKQQGTSVHVSLGYLASRPPFEFVKCVIST